MYSSIKISLIAISIFLISSISNAEDIDIINTDVVDNANILFVMDLSGSMDTLIDGSTETRLEELRGAFQDIVTDPDFDEVNFGLSVFSGEALAGQGQGSAHGISYPVSPIIGTPAQDILSKTGFTHPSNSYMPAAGAYNSREYLGILSSDTSIWTANGSTPIVDALFEAARYFRGEEVLWGRYGAEDIRSAHPASYDGTITSIVSSVPQTCSDETREDCEKGSCGTTEVCTMWDSTFWSSTDLGSCDADSDGRQTCDSDETSCGLGTNCTERTYTSDRTCSGSDISSCQNSNPTWYNCSVSTSTNTSYDNEGIPIDSETSEVRCSEDVTRTTCDEDISSSGYSCPTQEEGCTQCPADIETTVPSGTGVYKSPIINECSANAIILLTDGAPTANSSADEVATMIGSTYANGCNTGSSEDGRCGPELANFMNSEDHADGSTSVPVLPGIQNVKTYAIGLALDMSVPDEAATKAYLDEISLNGNGGSAIIAGNKAELTAAFKDSINSVVKKARSFSSPSYTVDTTTSLTNGEYVYIPVFDSSASLWPGNLKKYKLVDGVVTDADGNAALDSANGLLDTARDFWSSDASVDSITSGGAANKLIPTTGDRNILTDNGTATTDATALITLSNAIANSEFGLTTSTADTSYKSELVTFIGGLNPVDGSARNHMGDIIHSKPVQLSLSSGRKAIFIGSNEGYLHAINDYGTETDIRNGTEAFAYMPNELLVNIKNQYAGTASDDHIYGVDGEITLWLDESANTVSSEIGNNILEVAKGEKAYIFFGLRRGGSTYTALEVTDPDNPRLVWSKSFDTGNSWSQPSVNYLKWSPNSTEKPVIVIGGGFNDDDTGSEIAGGNNVYIVDAMTGTSVWSAQTAIDESNVSNYTGTSLPNAVPSSIRVLDVDRNNSIDRLYFGDTGGNVWRVDLNAANIDGDASTAEDDLTEATLHRVASLGGTAGDDRQFFEEPDVAIFNNNGSLVTSIAIGSGSRPNPLSVTTEDKFFLLYDSEVSRLPTESLITLTSNNLEAVPVNTTASSGSDYRGWYKSMDTASGEKILSSALTYQGKVLFNSFGVSSVASTDSCSSSSTSNTLYIVDLFTGDEEAVVTHTGGEIIGEPKIVYHAISPCVTGDCQRETSVVFGKNTIAFPDPVDANGDPVVDYLGNTVSGDGDTMEKVYWFDKNN